MDEIEVTPILVKTQLGSSRASALDRRIQEKFLLQSPLLAERKTLNQTKPTWLLRLRGRQALRRTRTNAVLPTG